MRVPLPALQFTINGCSNLSSLVLLHSGMYPQCCNLLFLTVSTVYYVNTCCTLAVHLYCSLFTHRALLMPDVTCNSALFHYAVFQLTISNI